MARLGINCVYKLPKTQLLSPMGTLLDKKAWKHSRNATLPIQRDLTHILMGEKWKESKPNIKHLGTECTIVCNSVEGNEHVHVLMMMLEGVLTHQFTITHSCTVQWHPISSQHTRATRSPTERVNASAFWNLPLFSTSRMQPICCCVHCRVV